MDGTEVNQLESGNGLSFTMGKGQVIPGMDIAIRGMFSFVILMYSKLPSPCCENQLTLTTDGCGTWSCHRSVTVTCSTDEQHDLRRTVQTFHAVRDESDAGTSHVLRPTVSVHSPHLQTSKRKSRHRWPTSWPSTISPAHVSGTCSRIVSRPLQ